MPKWYPLDWPESSPRSESPKSARFKVGFDRALEETRIELRRLGSTSVCISTNLQLARDGWPDPRSRLNNEDPGVAVYWMLGGAMHVLACDAWDRVEDNLHAITLTLSADRGKARWGCSSIVNRSMSAYKALPAPPNERAWWEILEVVPGDTLGYIETKFKLLMMKAHPDAGGSHDRATELQWAIEQARKEKRDVS